MEVSKLKRFERKARMALMRHAHTVCRGRLQDIAELLGTSDATIVKDKTYRELQGLKKDD